MLMKLYSYVVARDFGFAPNPFFGFCTLATCKPQIRQQASVGDWVIGTGAKAKYHYGNRLIFALNVSEILTFNQYWWDPRFFLKRPNMTGSLKVLYGDNIYHHDGTKWVQADSHHSLPNGLPNDVNTANDTKVDHVLVGTKFVYWGQYAPAIPKGFCSFGTNAVCIVKKGRGHRVFADDLPGAFDAWINQQGRWGVQGNPIEFRHHAPQLRFPWAGT